MKFTGKTQGEVDFEAQAKASEMCRLNRLQAYRDESDPLYMKWQRGETTQEAWLDKIEEIKARFPKP